MRVLFLLVLTCIPLFHSPLAAQNPLDALRRRGAEVLQSAAAGRVVGQVLDHLLDPRRQPVTSSFDDALRDSVLPAEFDPGPYAPLASLPRTADGGFVLRPGAYQMTVQSYCLHAGTYGPSRGRGYLPAPLEGPRADVVRAVLERAVFHPEIPQRKIQVLLWAMMARTPYERMPADMQLTARTLLTAPQLLEINGGPLSLLPQRYETQLRQAFDQRVARLSAPLQRIARAESQLRQQVAQSASYEAMEAAAVLTGVAPVEAGAAAVPWGQWMRTAEGFFIRYLPAGYARTLVQVFVPPQLRAAMLILNLAIWLAMPASTGSQRLAMSGREGDGRPPPPIVHPPDAASPMPQPDCPPPGDEGCDPNVTGEVRIDEGSAGHIFQDHHHLADTPANRRALLDLVSDRRNFLGVDMRGNSWYATTRPDGTQLWASVRGNLVRNGGVNLTPRSWNPQTGLSGTGAP